MIKTQCSNLIQIFHSDHDLFSSTTHLHPFSFHEHPSMEGLVKTASGCPGAEVTRCRSVGHLNNRNVFSHSSRAKGSRSGLSAGLVASQG